MLNNHVASIRKDYQLASLDESQVGDNPIDFFAKWFDEAQQAKVHEVNAMTLATIDKNNFPDARIVLLKGFDEKGFTFFTNYNSQKGQSLLANPKAALVFFWQELERQVRIQGLVEKLSDIENDDYFNSRPDASKLGAWSSPQSQIISERAFLDENFQRYKLQFQQIPIPRPTHWGGYRVIPNTIEFWQGRSSRMHDRIVFQREGASWKKTRLAP